MYYIYILHNSQTTKITDSEIKNYHFYETDTLQVQDRGCNTKGIKKPKIDKLLKAQNSILSICKCNCN